MAHAPRRRGKQRTPSSLHALGTLLLTQELVSLSVLAMAERKTYPNRWDPREAYNTSKAQVLPHRGLLSTLLGNCGPVRGDGSINSNKSNTGQLIR